MAKAITPSYMKISTAAMHKPAITMKKEFVIGVCLFGLIIGLVVVVISLQPLGISEKPTVNESANSQQKTISGDVLGGQSPSNFILDTAPGKAPEKVMVYKTLPVVISKTDAIEFARKFNITDFNEPKEGDAVISVSSKDMRYNIELYKNGGSRYSDYKRIDTPNGIDIPENLPSDAEAEKIATEFLMEKGLLPEEAVFRGSEHRKIFRSDGSGSQPVVVWEDITIWYSRKIDGMNVEGTQFEIEVGGHGDIISFFTNWKDYQPSMKYPVKSGESAFNELKQKRISVGTGPVKPDVVSITQVYLAYYTKSVAYPEEYLEPVWVLKGTASVNGKPVDSIEELIPALTDESVKSLASS